MTTYLLLILSVAAPVPAEIQPPQPDDASLAQAVWHSSPAVADARRGLVAAQGDVAQAKLFLNPEVNAAWGTIPVGARNPPELPFWDVPYYAVGITQTVELGKRGPRQQAVAAFARGQQQQVFDVYRKTFFDVLTAVTSSAEAELYLNRGLTADEPPPAYWAERRPDIQALRAQSEGLRSLDTKDSFVMSGNQRQSLTLGISMPLPIFDRGQIAANTAWT